jgi:hypothetical protein
VRIINCLPCVDQSGTCKVIRLTIDDDLRTSAGLQKALRIIKMCPKGRTLLWSAMPCAGGSPWRTLNISRGKGFRKIKAHWGDFQILWDNFVIAAKAVIDIDGILAIEWPERCKYWREQEVDTFLKEFQFDQRIFHGCA